MFKTALTAFYSETAKRLAGSLSRFNKRNVLFLFRFNDHSIVSAQVHGIGISLTRIVYAVSFAGQSPGLCRARLTRVQIWKVFLESAYGVYVFLFPSGNDIVLYCDCDVKWRFWHNVLFWMPFCLDSRPLGSLAGYDFYGFFISFYWCMDCRPSPLCISLFGQINTL